MNLVHLVYYTSENGQKTYRLSMIQFPHIRWQQGCQGGLQGDLQRWDAHLGRSPSSRTSPVTNKLLVNGKRKNYFKNMQKIGSSSRTSPVALGQILQFGKCT